MHGRHDLRWRLVAVAVEPLDPPLELADRHLLGVIEQLALLSGRRPLRPGQGVGLGLGDLTVGQRSGDLGEASQLARQLDIAPRLAGFSPVAAAIQSAVEASPDAAATLARSAARTADSRTASKRAITLATAGTITASCRAANESTSPLSTLAASVAASSAASTSGDTERTLVLGICLAPVGCSYQVLWVRTS